MKHKKFTKKSAQKILKELFGSDGKAHGVPENGPEWFAANYGRTEVALFYTETHGIPVISIHVSFGSATAGQYLCYDPETLELNYDLQELEESKLRGAIAAHYLEQHELIAVDSYTASLYNLESKI